MLSTALAKAKREQLKAEKRAAREAKARIRAEVSQAIEASAAEAGNSEPVASEAQA